MKASWFFLMAMVLTGATTAKGWSVLKVDGPAEILKAEPLAEPYLSDATYTYARSPSFNRWIYNTWAPPHLDSAGLALTNPAGAGQRSVLISEYKVRGSGLQTERTYELAVEVAYSCHPATAGDVCEARLVARCFGPTPATSWGMTWEKSTAAALPAGEGVLRLEGATFAGDKCRRGLTISSEADLAPLGLTYTFRYLKVGLIGLPRS